MFNQTVYVGEYIISKRSRKVSISNWKLESGKSSKDLGFDYDKVTAYDIELEGGKIKLGLLGN